MSAAENSNAFPAHPESFADERGMSLRDWFAGQALSGLLAIADKAMVPAGMTGEEGLAAQSYNFADAMLAERAKTGGAA